MQRSRRHRNCRISGLMSNILTFPLKTVFYPGFRRNITSVQVPVLKEKKFYYWTSLVVMCYIASLAKLSSCCNTVWAHRQGEQKGKSYSLSFSSEVEKSYTLFYNVFSILTCYNSLGYRKLSQCQHVFLGALLIWHSCYYA